MSSPSEVTARKYYFYTKILDVWSNCKVFGMIEMCLNVLLYLSSS